MKTARILLALLLVLSALTGPIALAAEADPVTQQLLDTGIAAYFGLTDVGFDRETALENLQMAADRGSGEAWYYIGRLYEKSCATGRYQQAMECYDRAIELGCAKGYFGKGELYRQGFGVEKDPTYAYSLYEQAVNLGCLGANVGFGNMCRFGDGTDLSGESAIYFYSLALDCGDYELVNLARHGIASVYKLGVGGVEVDFEQALAWYMLAADDNFGYSMTNLGVMYELGEGVEPSKELADAWYNRASFHGDGMAVWKLAWDYLELMEPDYATGYSMFEYAATLGNTPAQLELGEVFFYGELGMEQNYAMALDWFNIALEANEPEAMYWIGKIYYYGDDTVPVDKATAAAWFQMAADNGDPHAMDYLGYMYIYGQGVEQNYEAALNWFVNALWYAGDNQSLIDTVCEDIDILVSLGYTTWDEVDAIVGW